MIIPRVSHVYHIRIGADASPRGTLLRQRQTMAQITCPGMAVNQEQLTESCEYSPVVGRRCFECFGGWARGRGPTLAACSMHLIEGKVNIGKNRSSLENVTSSLGTQAESSRSHGVQQNRPAPAH